LQSFASTAHFNDCNQAEAWLLERASRNLKGGLPAALRRSVLRAV